MKFKDIKTFEHLLKEYGMSAGTSTPVGDQSSGAKAKASAASKASFSPTMKQTPSPTMKQGSTANPDPKDSVKQKPVIAKARELKKDFEFPDEKGNVVKVISPYGQGKNKNSVIVQNQKNKEFYTIKPEDKIQLPQVKQDDITEKFDKDRIIKRKHRLHRKIKRLLRAQKHMQQGEPIFEINFNSREVAQGALNAQIACGFEAETVWPNLGEGTDSNYEDTDWLDDLYWNRVSDLIYDQEGARSLERVEEAYREWLSEEILYDVELEVISELVEERKEDEAYINDFIISNSSLEDEIEEYKQEKLERLEIDDMQDELEEYSDWDDDAWAREYVEVHKEDEFVEWLEEQIRDNGEAFDEAWHRATDQYDYDDWVRREHSGSWYSLLSDLDIYLYNEDADGGGVDAVASVLEDWASNNSKSNDVRPGGYHSGKGVDNTYWRVEDDSSIEGEGAKAEIISPVYDSPAQMLKEMKSLFEYMDNNDVETNSSTGLHITMSFPNEGVEKANRLKMAVLLGDKYVLKQFGREQNSYTKSQQETLQKYVKNLQTNIKDQKSLDAIEEILLGGISAGKFSSINFKNAENSAGNQLIEFRVAGGEDYHLMSDKVMKAVIRYAAVMQAGHDPEAYRKDYIKALFKMIAGKDTVSGDVVKRAQTMVDPASINDKVLAAFQAIASEKHYTDAIEALSNAYMVLADAQSAKNANPQQEMPFEAEGDEEDWRRTMIKAQKYFVRAFAILTSDLASGANRAKPTAAVVASLRQALKDFGFTPKTLWDQLQKSEFYVRFPGQVHDKSAKFASAVNSLLKKQDAKALEPAFTVKFNPGTQRMFMPGPIADAVNTASGNNIFGKDGGAGQLPAQFTPKMFKVIDDDEYRDVHEERWEFETSLEQHNQQLEIIQSFKDSIKQHPERADDYKEAMAHRLADVEKLKKHMAINQKAMDAFMSKYGFVPPSVRHRSETMGNDWKMVSIDDLSWLSANHNIKFTATESVFDRFDKLPVLEQLSLLEKIDKKKIDEAWSAKYKKSINCDNPKGFSQKAHCAGKKKANEGDVIRTKFATKLAQKGKDKYRKTDIEIPTRDGEPYDRFDYKETESGSNAHIIGIIGNKGYKISTAPLQLAKTLVDMYNRGGFTDKDIKQLDPKDVFEDQSKRQFKRDELEHELGHEKNNYAVMIDGKTWKVVANKSRAQKMVQTLVRKGKNAKYAETGMPVSETIEAEQDMSALLTAYGTPKKKKKKKTNEEAANDFNRAEIVNGLMADHFPVSDLKKQMLAYQAIPMPQMLDAFRDLRAQAGDNACARSIVRHFVSALPRELQQQVNLNESRIFESSNKEDAKELVQLSSTPSVLATVVKYLRGLVSNQTQQQDVSQDPVNTAAPADNLPADQEQQVENESIIKEDLNSLKQEAFALIDKVKDETELNQLVAFLKKNEIYELAHAAIEANITQGVKGGLDKKLGQMVLDASGTFEDKQKFLQQLATGNGYWDGNDLITNPTGNIYDKLSSSPIASELAKPIALELRGRMGYGPDQGPGEFLLAFTGKGVDLAEKSDLVLIDGKGVEVKAEGWSKDAKGNTKKSGGRLYSTSGYNGGSGAGKLFYATMLEVGIPKEVLAKEYGWGVKRNKTDKYPSLNFNSVGVNNLNDLLAKYGKPGAAQKILNSIADGFFLSLPSGMKDAFVKKSAKGNVIDFKEAMHNFVALGHDYYRHQEGHDYIMIFNTATGDYVMVNTGEDMKKLLDAGVLKTAGGMDFFDDRSKGTPQILIGSL